MSVSEIVEELNDRKTGKTKIFSKPRRPETFFGNNSRSNTSRATLHSIIFK